MKPIFLTPEVPARKQHNPEDVAFVRELGSVTVHGDWLPSDHTLEGLRDFLVPYSIKFKVPYRKLWNKTIPIDEYTEEMTIRDLKIMTDTLKRTMDIFHREPTWFQMECEYFKPQPWEETEKVTALLQRFNNAVLDLAPHAETIWTLRNPPVLYFGCGDIKRTYYGTPSLYDLDNLQATFKELDDCHNMFGNLWPVVGLAWNKVTGNWDTDMPVELSESIGAMLKSIDYVKGVMLYKGALRPPPLWNKHFKAFMKGFK